MKLLIKARVLDKNVNYFCHWLTLTQPIPCLSRYNLRVYRSKITYLWAWFEHWNLYTLKCFNNAIISQILFEEMENFMSILGWTARGVSSVFLRHDT